MSLFWIVIRQLAEIEEMVKLTSVLIFYSVKLVDFLVAFTKGNEKCWV